MTDPLRFGVLRLSDSAPAVLAEAAGLFAAEGLDVDLQIEPSWANIADKLVWGKLDAAIMLPPLVLAAVAGLRGKRARLVVPMGITEGGNAIAVGPSIAATLPPGRLDATIAGHALRDWLRGQKQPPRFAVVHVFSTHNILLRYWLAASGIDPDRDIETVVVPPERVVAALQTGQIAGFCAGPPWGEHAARIGAGRVLLGTSSIRPRHAEKCLALAADWAADRPASVAALLRALRQAKLQCGVAAQAPALAALLAQRLALPEAAARATLPGGDGVEQISFAPAAPVQISDALWFLGQMDRWGWLPPGTDLPALAAKVYQPPQPGFQAI